MFPAVVDSSMLSSYKSCPQKFFKSHIQYWSPKERSVHLVAGAAFAKGVEVARKAFYEQNLDPETSVAMGLQALMEEYGDFSPNPDSPKSLERTAGALEYYFTNYPLNQDSPPIILSDGRRAIEFGSVQPLPVKHPETSDPILFSGRWDAILQMQGLSLMTDEKTTTSLGPTWSQQWDLRGQFTGYKWLCECEGIHVDGVLVRGVSILKTKYDTQQAISFRPQWQVDRWLNETCEILEEMIRRYTSGRWPHNLDHACAEFGGCGFRMACRSLDPLPHLETAFERKRWDPVLRTEVRIETVPSVPA